MAATVRTDAAQVASEPFIVQFLEEGFDASAYVRSVMREDVGLRATDDGSQSSAEQALDAVQRGLSLLDEATKSLVYSNQSQLITHAKATQGLSDRVASLQIRSHSLQTLANRARSDVLAPAEALERDTQAFERAIEASEAVKMVQTLHSAFRKAQLLWQRSDPAAALDGVGSNSTSTEGIQPALDSLQNADSRVLSRLSPLLAAANSVLAERSLRGVHLVEGYRKPVGAMTKALRHAATQLLGRAIDALDATDIAIACVILHDLRCLPVEVAAAVDRLSEVAASSIRQVLDVQELAAAAAASAAGQPAQPLRGVDASSKGAGAPSSRPGTAGSAVLGNLPSMPPAGAAAMWRGLLWGRIEACLDVLQRCLVQAWTLVHVLARRNVSLHHGSAVGAGGMADGRHASSNSSTSVPLLLDIAMGYARQSGARQPAGGLSSRNRTAGPQAQAPQTGGPHVAAAVHPRHGPWTSDEVMPHHPADDEAGHVDSNGPASAADYLHGGSSVSAAGRNASVRLLRRVWLGLTTALTAELATLIGSLEDEHGGSGAHGGSASIGLDRGLASSFASSLVSAASSLMTGSGPGSAGGPGSRGKGRAAQKANFVRSVLLEAYPRLHYLLQDCLSRAARSVQLRSSSDESGLTVGTSWQQWNMPGEFFDDNSDAHGQNSDAYGQGQGRTGYLSDAALNTALASVAYGHAGMMPSGGSPQALSSWSAAQHTGVAATGTKAGAHPELHAAVGMLQPRLTGSELFAVACAPSELLHATRLLQAAYLARTSSRLADALAVMFPPSMAQAIAERKAAQKRYGASGVGPAPSGAPGRAGSAVPALGAPPSRSALASLAAGFTQPQDFDRLQTEPQPEAPSAAAALAFIRVCQQELAACRPAGMVQAGTGAKDGTKAAPGAKGTQGGPLSQPDPQLYRLVADRVYTAITEAVRQAEACAGTGAAVTAIAEHWGPTSAQALNLSLASRLEEVRGALVKAIGEIPLWPPVLERTADVPATDPAVVAAHGRRLARHPLALPLPPALEIINLAVERQEQLDARAAQAAGFGDAKSTTTRTTVPGADSAQAVLLRALRAMDASIERLVLPWLTAVSGPLEHCIARVGDGLYSSSRDAQPVSSSTYPSALSSAGHSSMGGPGGTSVGAGESDWLASLEAHCSRLAARQLNGGLLPNSGHGGATAVPLATVPRNALAARAARTFLRYASIVRPMDEAGRARLARDASQLESALAVLLPPGAAAADAGGKGGAGDAPGVYAPGLALWTEAKAELKAFRALLFASTEDVAAALSSVACVQLALPSSNAQVLRDGPDSATAGGDTDGSGTAGSTAEVEATRQRVAAVLHALGPSTLLHAMSARLPRACDMPHTKARVDGRTYVGWQDAVLAIAMEQQLQQQQQQQHQRASITDGKAAGPTDPPSAATGAAADQSASTARFFPSQTALHVLDTAIWSRMAECLQEYKAKLEKQGGPAAPSIVPGTSAAASASTAVATAAAAPPLEYVLLTQAGGKIASGALKR